MLSSMNEQRPCTYDEVRSWGAVVDLSTAARAFKLGRTAAYRLAAAGEFPAKCTKVGRRWRVSTQDILAVLGAKESA
jgi:hypothetical protein